MYFSSKGILTFSVDTAQTINCTITVFQTKEKFTLFYLFLCFLSQINDGRWIFIYISESNEVKTTEVYEHRMSSRVKPVIKYTDLNLVLDELGVINLSG